MLEEDYFFNCPYCFAEISIRVDLTGGRKQSFSYDCEVCCRPIAVQIETEDSEVIHFKAERELE